MIDIIVFGAGPAGVLAALRAADLGARTMLVTRAEFGGMAANDGPVPVRTLAHAARLIREARQLGQYGIGVSEPVLDYRRLLARVCEVVEDVRAHSSLRQQIDSLGVTVHEHAGVARFADQHTIETEGGLRLQAEKIIICTGGVSRRLPVPGFELASTHSEHESSSSRQAHASYRARMKRYRQRFQRPSEGRGSWCMRTSARSILSRRPRRGCE